MESLKIIPLGGLGEFGLNMMLVEYGDAAIAVDCGVMFPTADLLGIDLVIPDVSYLLERRDKLKGIVLTHAQRRRCQRLAVSGTNSQRRRCC